MSYDLAIWVGEPPADDAAATREYDARADAAEANPRPTDDRYSGFVEALLERFPEDSDDGVWAVEPVLEDEAGDFLCLTMTVSDHLDDVVDHAAALAGGYGLVVYDPQRECLVGDPSDDRAESWSDRVLPE